MLDPRNTPEKELSEESCELEVAAVLPLSCLQHMDSSNWKKRISCLEALEKVVKGMEKTMIPCQALVRLLDREPGWNETKLQVMLKKIRIVTLVAQRGDFSRTSAQFVLGNLVEKIGDVICCGDSKEALTAVAEACGLPWTAGKVAEAAFLHSSPRTHSEALNWLSSAIKDFGFDGLEARAFIDYIKFALGAAHPDVRASAFNLLGVMYLYIGAPLRAFFEDEKLVLLSQIDAEFEKVRGQNPPAPSRGPCKLYRDGEQRGGDAQPCQRQNAVDISEQISSELLLKMYASNWKARKEGLEEIAEILSMATSIQPNIGDLSVALKACLQDSNKALVKQTLSVLQQLARAMGPDIRHHIRTLGMSIIAVLKDSKSSLRVAALATVESWTEQTGMKAWLEGDGFSTDLKDSFLQRQELLGWLVEKLPSSSSASAELVRCLPQLYVSMEHSHEDMRVAAHDALPFFLLHLGFEKMAEATNHLKPASKDLVLSMLGEAKHRHLVKATLGFTMPFPKLPRGKSRPKPISSSSQLCNPEFFSSENLGSNHLATDIRKARSDGVVPKPKRVSNVKAQAKLTAKDGSRESEPIFIVIPKAKEQRVKDEKALKVLRWNFNTPSSKHVEQLKAQMSGCLTIWLQEELFHPNFQHHIKALTIMTKHLESEKEGVISCLDLILKWLSLRLFDINTWVLMKTLEYLKRLFGLLIEEGYQMTDNEASSFFPYLLLKMGGTKESILKEVRLIVKQTTQIYPTSKVFGFLLEGVRSKNANQRVGCLKELGWLFRAYGPEVCQPNPSKALKIIIATTGDSNNTVHNAALKVISIARDVYGVENFKVIGNISDKHMSLLEDSIKEARDKHVQEESVDSQFFTLNGRTVSVESPKQSLGASNPRVERTSLSQVAQAEGKNTDSKVPCKNPDPAATLKPQIHVEPQHEDAIAPNVNMLICRVASGDVGTSIEALVQIEEILRKKDQAETMLGHINPFLIAALRQLKFIHRLHVTEAVEMRKGQVMELYSCVICNMVSLFQVPSLAQEASAGVLKDLLNSLIALLLDSPVEELQERQQVTQSVRLLINKVLEKSDHSRLLSTLLLLLHEGLAAATDQVVFSEMVAKCLWKSTKLLPQTFDSLNLDQTLLDIHIFMKALPKEKLKQYQSNYPLRALRALLHTLCRLKGADILDHLTLIEDRGESELEAHLCKTVGHLTEKACSEANKSLSCPPNSKDNRTLSEIFKKIHTKETARAGLEELYEHKKQNPDADLEPFLKSGSLFFRSYVKHGLAVIESEQEGKPNHSSSEEQLA